MSRLSLQGIHKAFGDLQALEDVDIDVEDGSFFVLVGPSGAGKTTTLRIMAGLEEPDEGDVLFDGRSADGVAPAARDIAMVFQDYALYPKKNAFENIASPLRARRVEEEEISSRVHEIAELLHIDHLLERPPGQLSGGEQQRVALGRALVREPRAFLMDEPLTNLDLKLRAEMRTEMTRLHRQVGRTFLFVTNDQVEAMSMADRLAVLHQGRIQQIGTPQDVYDRPANRFVAGFIGSPRMNFLPCRLEDDELVGDGWRLPAPELGSVEGTDDLELGIRPEDLFLDESSPHTLEGSVYAVEPLGDRTLIDVEVGEVVVKVKGHPTAESDYAIGDEVRISVDLDRAHVFAADGGSLTVDAGGADAPDDADPEQVGDDAPAAAEPAAST